MDSGKQENTEKFDIDPDPTVQVSKNGKIVQNASSIYGGRGPVKNLQCWICWRYCSVTVTWKLSNLLFLYKDILRAKLASPWQIVLEHQRDWVQRSALILQQAFYFHGTTLRDSSVEKVNNLSCQAFHKRRIRITPYD